MKYFLSLALVLSLSTQSYSQFYRFDHIILENLSKNRTPGATKFFQGVSNSASYISLAVPVGLFVAGAIDHNVDLKKNALYITESIAISSVITIGLKYAVNRPRPYTTDSLITKAGEGGSPSFPSGHTSQAFSTATALAIAYPKWYVIAPAYLWATTVSFSRLYLGVHYPTDVIAGAIVGSGSAWLAYKANKWIRQKKEAKHSKGGTAFAF
jgi:undecaprenyl-diphosphatase